MKERSKQEEKPQTRSPLLLADPRIAAPPAIELWACTGEPCRSSDGGWLSKYIRKKYPQACFYYHCPVNHMLLNSSSWSTSTFRLHCTKVGYHCMLYCLSKPSILLDSAKARSIRPNCLPSQPMFLFIASTNAPDLPMLFLLSLSNLQL